MHILVSETSQVAAIGDTTFVGSSFTTVLASPLLRPRLEGVRGALKGDAYSAHFADTAKVAFTVRFLAGDIPNNFQALLTVEQSPRDGQNPEATYPSPVLDVSGAFAIDGRISVDVALHGVCRVTLQLNRIAGSVGGANGSIFALCQVLAEERAIDVETVLHDRGET